MILAFLLFAVVGAASPDGARLHPDTACYTIFASAGDQERAIGVTAQTVARERLDGRDVWRIVVHQRLADGRFDMRDAFVLDAQTLRPFSLETLRNGKPHASLVYRRDRVIGRRWDDAGVEHLVDQRFATPVWEGNLFGLTFAALPLAPGARFEVPFFQYDKGFGVFSVAVKGTETVATPDGPIDAWVLEASPNSTQRLDYLIARKDGRELGGHRQAASALAATARAWTSLRRLLA